ncbi:MAG: restriction endonuclease, partial [bacterium]
RGMDLLAEKPNTIDSKFLLRYDEFKEFRFKRLSAPSQQLDDSITSSTQKTPEELLQESFESLNSNLAEDLLDSVKSCSPHFFERLVVELLVKMGYGGSLKDAGEAVGRSGDEGIDGLIKEDKLGLDTVYIQAKRWQATVGRPELHKFAGALQGKRAKKGVFITTSDFTKEAREYTAQIDSKIALIDGQTLAKYMIDFDIGVSKESTYEVKRIDSDYFIED